MELIGNAMELNNTGVLLLRKGHISKAIKTFKMLTMALARRTREPGALSDAIGQDEKTFSSRFRDEKENLIQIMPIDNNDESAQIAAVYYGSSSSVAFPLRLVQEEDSDQTPSAIYITVVALYNHGVAIHCRYANQRCQRKVLASAEKSLRTAKMILRQSRDHFDLNGNVQKWNATLSLITNALQQVLAEQELWIKRERDVQNRGSMIHPSVTRYAQATACRKVQMIASAA